MSAKKPNIKPEGATKPPAPTGPSSKVVKAPPRDPGKTAAQLAELGPRSDTVTTLSKSEAQRLLAWFGSATIAAPGDFELAARIRRAFE